MNFKRAIFASKGTFFGMLGLAGLSSFFYFNYKNDLKLKHPLVDEAIKILELNNEITELIGFPLIYESSIQNKAIFDDENAFLKFKVTGTRGNIEAELNGICKTFENLKKDKNESITDFYILDKELKNKLNNIEEYSNQKILNNDKFWKIEYLITNQNEIITIPVIPSESYNKLNFKFDNNKRNIIKDLLDELKFRSKLYKSYSSLTEEEKEELYKIRVKENSLKFKYIRFAIISFMVTCVVFTFNYLKVNKKLSVYNIDLIEKAKQLILKNNDIKNLIGNKPIYFNSTVLGHHNNREAILDLQFYGENFKGMFLSDSKYDKNFLEWKFNSIKLKLEINDEVKEFNINCN